MLFDVRRPEGLIPVFGARRGHRLFPRHGRITGAGKQVCDSCVRPLRGSGYHRDVILNPGPAGKLELRQDVFEHRSVYATVIARLEGTQNALKVALAVGYQLAKVSGGTKDRRALQHGNESIQVRNDMIL